jgi:hypothetical protein
VALWGEDDDGGLEKKNMSFGLAETMTTSHLKRKHDTLKGRARRYMVSSSGFQTLEETTLKSRLPRFVYVVLSFIILFGRFMGTSNNGSSGPFEQVVSYSGLTRRVGTRALAWVDFGNW